DLSYQPAKEDLSYRWVLEQGEDEVTVMVESGGTADERHEAIRVRQLKKPVDVGIGQALRHHAEHKLRPELRSQPLAPAPFVLTKRALAQFVLPQRVSQHLCRNRRAHNTIVDPTACRRL